ncbi:hypothetical protein [Streptomyces sp. NPDC005780]|uniref:hypothetical protein n=1 Tax=Streptomyces sp. NPDC005780 TaxID=3364730 RepID=UPI0036A069B3
MHSDTSDNGDEKLSRWERVRRILRIMGSRFLHCVAYSSGTACVSVAVLWAQHHM